MVMVILMALMGIALVTFPGAQQTSRDTRRKSDVRQFQTSIESFANRNNGLYPNYGGGTGMGPLCTTLALAGACVDDPRSPTTVYRYISAGGSGAAGSATATSFVIYATLEKPVAGAAQYWVTCSNGTIGRINVSSWTPSATCPNLTN